MNKLTLSGLFDGSGGFPLGGLISGIAPVIGHRRSSRFLFGDHQTYMKHYGDVSKMDGGNIRRKVDITFGSLRARIIPKK